MKKYLQRLTLLLICITTLSNIGYSQSTYRIKETKEFDIKLLGTSSLHDWEMDTLSTTGEAQFVFKSGSESDLVSIKYLSFALKVEDLKGESNGLNKNAYEALKSDKHKEIYYNLTSSSISPEKGGYLIKSKGNLIIAGVTKEILMDVHGVINNDGTVAFKGSYQLKMTDYNVKPPSFMWGAMKTGDAITLNFLVVYKKGKRSLGSLQIEGFGL